MPQGRLTIAFNGGRAYVIVITEVQFFYGNWRFGMGNSEESQQARDSNFDINRRDFAKMALGGAALLASASSGSAKLALLPPGIKIGTYAKDPTAENMLYLRQLGVKWISSSDITPATATAQGFTRMREQWEAGGFHVWNETARIAPNGKSVISVPEVVLNLPGRDERIKEFQNYLRYLSKADLHYMTYAFMGNGIWRSGRVTTPRGYNASDCNVASPNFVGRWNGGVFKEPLSNGRVFSREEVWDNYTYFMKKVVPVAEDTGVRIGIHPDDPPIPMLAGVPRIFTSFEGYKRAIEIANSPNVGVCLCVGSWLEGGPRMGADPVEVIKYFGARKKLWKIHFRNVSSPVPHFHETLMDDGYYDMSKVMDALVEINFDGLVIPDHVPALVGDGMPGERREAAGRYRASTGLAYSMSYLNASLKAALTDRRKG
jgi:mannonate dehydratase